MSLAQTSVQLTLPQSPFPPLAVGFMSLACVYVASSSPPWRPMSPSSARRRGEGPFHLGTGLWLMYLVFAVALDFILKYTLSV
jgi:hypothetical protein